MQSNNYVIILDKYIGQNNKDIHLHNIYNFSSVRQKTKVTDLSSLIKVMCFP